MKNLILIIATLFNFSLVAQIRPVSTVVIPKQTGNAGKVLGTDGFKIDWINAGDVTSTSTNTLSNKTYTNSLLNGTTTVTGIINEYKATNAASSSTVNLNVVNGNYVHITGTNTINSFGSCQAGSERVIVYESPLTVSNSTNIILPGNASISASANDVMIVRSEGSNIWRCISYTSASDAYTNFTPTFTGFSIPPTVNAGDCRYKMIGRNTCHFIFYPSNLGTSNATTFTITLPFVAANVGFGGQTYIVQLYNNGGSATGVMRTRLNSNIADVYTANFGTFTASSGKSLICSIVYQTGL